MILCAVRKKLYCMSSYIHVDQRTALYVKQVLSVLHCFRSETCVACINFQIKKATTLNAECTSSSEFTPTADSLNYSTISTLN